jgi:hypothetical protein
MADDLNKEYKKSNELAQAHFRKDVSGFHQRRGLELEDLLLTEREKPEEFQDKAKIEWLLQELRQVERTNGD